MKYWNAKEVRSEAIDRETYAFRRANYVRWRASAAGKKFVANKLVKQNYGCFYCARSIRRAHQLDHVTPLWLGGRNHHTNYVLACIPCNERKSANSPYKDAVRHRRNELAKRRSETKLAKSIVEQMCRDRGWF